MAVSCSPQRPCLQATLFSLSFSLMPISGIDMTLCHDLKCVVLR